MAEVTPPGIGFAAASAARARVASVNCMLRVVVVVLVVVVAASSSICNEADTGL